MPAPGRPQATSDTDAALLLDPALTTLWRDHRTVQFGLDCDPLVVHDVDATTRVLLERLDGRQTGPQLLAELAATGYDEVGAGLLLGELRRAGVVVAADPGAHAGLGGPCEVDRLGPDIASMALLARAARTRPSHALVRRRAAQVLVHGGGRVGVPLAASLAAAGVGRVAVLDSGTVSLSETNVGGLRPHDEHRARQNAAADAIRRAAPTTRTGVGPRDRPCVAVLCDPWPTEELRREVHAAGTPHLPATVRETTGVLGPLVLPGVTSCLRCVDLHRSERDRAWPALLAQLTARRRRAHDPVDGPLALLVAATAALQVLAMIDAGGQVPFGVREASLELRLPDWKLRRRSWPAHARCGCGAASARRAG